jgi:predicted ATPase/class 3 adenylate cyclase
MPDLPSGTVTFLFTDIEGSTKLWEERPEVMRLALARHDALLREAIEQYNGVVFKTIGDAFCAAFPTAPEALEAALSAQKSLYEARADDGSDLMLKVRMALHTGTAEQRVGDYFGLSLSRVARLLAVGHGGQTLLSDVTHDLCRDTLPSDASLRLLGEHRLKDLFRPETVFQLLHPQLPVEFPPLRSLDNPALPNNLPMQVTSFIGREKEIGEVQDLLSKTRLLTLTGSGGCGKTRLSLQAGAEVLEVYPDGVWFVELAPLSDSMLVMQSVAQVVGVKEEASKPLQQTLCEFLKIKRLLLVLDNCEHLLTACAQLADALIRSCTHIKILASSREGFGIAGETTYRIPPLSMPDPKQTSTPTSLSQYEAVLLFVDRATAALPTFTVTNRNAPALASVCHHLDGIPLALELAAARVRSLSVEEIEARLGQRFRLLTGGNRTALPRQQTLKALIDWSYDLLTEGEKTLLHRLSVFAGGWTLTASEAVCSDVGTREEAQGKSPDAVSPHSSSLIPHPRIEDWEVLDLLTSLADKSLVLYEDREGQGRYNLLETVRQYAREKLRDSGEEQTTQERHLAYFLALAEETFEKRYSMESPLQMDTLEREHDNCRAALDFCVVSADAQTHLRLVGAIHWFWLIRGYYREGRARLDDALSRPDAQEITTPRARALNGAALLATFQNDSQAARPLLEQSGEIWRTLGEKRSLAMVLNNLGMLERQECRYDLAQAFFDESLALMRDLNDQAGMALVLGGHGLLARMQNDPARARLLLEESVALSRETGNLYVLEIVLGALAYVAMQLGDYATARMQFREALDLCAASHNDMNLIEVLEPIVELAACLQRPHQGVRLFAAAAAMRAWSGVPVFASDRADYDRRDQLLRAAIDAETFAEEWEAGFALTAEEAIALAKEIL